MQLLISTKLVLLHHIQQVLSWTSLCICYKCLAVSVDLKNAKVDKPFKYKEVLEFFVFVISVHNYFQVYLKEFWDKMICHREFCNYLSMVLLVIAWASYYGVDGKGFDANGEKDNGRCKSIYQIYFIFSF